MRLKNQKGRLRKRWINDIEQDLKRTKDTAALNKEKLILNIQFN